MPDDAFSEKFRSWARGNVVVVSLSARRESSSILKARDVVRL